MKERRRILVSGIVQGVGFRPFVYTLATRVGLVGHVRNNSRGVAIEVEGEADVINSFLCALEREKPPHAVIEKIQGQVVPLSTNGQTMRHFSIQESQVLGIKDALIPADISICDECLEELIDPADRRYHYPFINCTNCGPRFTIINDVPYDRPFTTMAPFQMCPACQAEYDDPGSRRFHAQPNACPTCGPNLQWIVDGQECNTLMPLTEAQHQLAQGAIVAIKGIGGYHLACDATNEKAVQKLRRRKHRKEKPMAIMAADLTAVLAICNITEAEAKLLTGPERPIVLVKQRLKTAVSPAVVPQHHRVGIMLPYTPLHYLLFVNAPFSYLVMTSANQRNEPIVFEDAVVKTALSHLADAILSHNRAIFARCDDSVVEMVNKKLPRFIRRARGFAPRPLSVGFEFEKPVLAVGGHLKNSFCLGKGRRAFLSPHMGDLENMETLNAYQRGVTHFQQLFDCAPEVVAHDLHPDYLSTRYALEQSGVTTVAVQHHHAHIASVMAEFHLSQPVIGFAFDGTGFGSDGTIWGGEVFIADLKQFERMAHLEPVSLPGGHLAIQQPWRMTVSWLYHLYGSAWQSHCPQTWSKAYAAVLPFLPQLIDKQLNAPLTSSMGRLFDAVSALIGICDSTTYEGQAAVELMSQADLSIRERYAFDVRWPIIDPAPLFSQLLADLQKGESATAISSKFHNGVVELITAVCLELREQRKINQVVLSGGVFQNSLLLNRTIKQLEKHNFEPFFNQQVPPNDGGLALGQAAVAHAQLEAQRCV